MKSENTGTATLAAEVLNVSPHGFWLLLGEREFFLGYEDFPWFRRATMEDLFEVELHHGNHLFWPHLDVDLDLDRIEAAKPFEPESFGDPLDVITGEERGTVTRLLDRIERRARDIWGR